MGSMERIRERQRWSSSTKAIIALLLLAAVVYIIARFQVVITPLIIASVLAYILNPLVNRVERPLGGRRWLATFLIYIVLICLAAIIPVLGIPPVLERLLRLALAFEDIVQSLDRFVGQTIVIGEVAIDGSRILEQIAGALRGFVEPLFGQTLGFAVGVLNSVVIGVFVLVISFYMVKDSGQILNWLKTLPPPGYRQDFIRLAEEANAIWSGFFRGQLILAAIVAGLFIIIGYVIGLPFALAMGVLAGLMEFIPSIGHTIWIVTAALLTLSQGSIWIPIPNWAMVIIVVFLHAVFIQVDVNVLIPRIIGRRIQLHPLVIILGIIAGASVAGVFGVVLVAPTIATARLIGRYIFANLTDQEPFPELGETETVTT